ncbi:MAG: hypothetical protein J7549_14250 [Variovorax sp.]|nr:hypothetical protein [Variovorax sp.]
MKLSHTTPIAAALLMAAFAPWSAVAAEGSGTWRCGNTYTDQPCKGGQRIEVDDTRDARQKHDADDSIREAHSAASRMEADRRRLEADGARNRPALIENTARQDVAPQGAAGKKTAAKTRRSQKETLYASPNSTAPKSKKKNPAGN